MKNKYKKTKVDYYKNKFDLLYNFIFQHLKVCLS